jgi:hypothetical protein
MDGKSAQHEGISDLDIQALVDGELDKEEERRLLSEIIRAPELLNRLEELMRQKKQIRNWWQFFRRD